MLLRRSNRCVNTAHVFCCMKGKSVINSRPLIWLRFYDSVLFSNGEYFLRRFCGIIMAMPTSF